MKKITAIVVFILLLCLMMTACSSKKEERVTEGPMQLRTPCEGDTVAIVKTTAGEFGIALYSRYVPASVDNFVKLAQSGYYDGLVFHRVEKDFLIQSGDPSGMGNGGTGATGKPIPDEYSAELHNFTGAVGYAKEKDDANGSQFYILCGSSVNADVVKAMQDADYSGELCDAYSEVGGWPQLDNRYTVFGQVYFGMDVVMEINGVQTDKFSRPVKDITIESITIRQYS